MKQTFRIGWGCMLILAICSTLSRAGSEKPNIVILGAAPPPVAAAYREMHDLHDAISLVVVEGTHHRDYAAIGKRRDFILIAADLHSSFLEQRLAESAERYRFEDEPFLIRRGYKFEDSLAQNFAVLTEQYKYLPPAINYPRPVNDPKPDNTLAQLIRAKSLNLRTLRTAHSS